MWFRTNGRVDASLNFNAKGALSFHTGQVELFGTYMTLFDVRDMGN